jgi:hypothetical protein
MGYGKDFLLNGGFDVIVGRIGYHEGYHKF